MADGSKTQEMDEDRRRESLIDTFASWALEGMEPTAQDIYYGREYIAGRMTPAQIIEEVTRPYRMATPTVDSNETVLEELSPNADTGYTVHGALGDC